MGDRPVTEVKGVDPRMLDYLPKQSFARKMN